MLLCVSMVVYVRLFCGRLCLYTLTDVYVMLSICTASAPVCI